MAVQYPNSIPTIMKDIVSTIETNLLADLQAYDSNIQTVAFFAGSWEEIKKRMVSFSKDPDNRLLRFPCVILIEDITIDQRGTAFFGEANLNIVIAHYTQKQLNSLERETIFANVLRPIYYELRKQMHRNRAFTFKSERDVKSIYIEHKFWGMEDATLNAFGDYTDAIELRNLETGINWKWCEQTITQNL